MSLLYFIILFSAGKLFYTSTDKTTSYTNLVQENTELTKSILRGKDVYLDFCLRCHLADGRETPGIIPPLDGSNWLTHKRTKSIHAVKFGQSGPIKVNGKMYNNTMPAMGLTDEEVADVMNYIMNSWSNKQSKMVTEAEVKAIKK